MNEYSIWYWEKKLEFVKRNLEKNRFTVYLTDNTNSVPDIIFSLLKPEDSIGLGGSLTLTELNIPFFLKEKNFNVINFPDKTLAREIVLEQRRQSLLSDAYLTSTNSITEDGLLVNIDCYSNRIAAMMFGPKKVLIIAGINKIVKDADAAVWKIKHYTAPQNCKRLNRNAPCVKTGDCSDCQTESRICCNTSIMGYQSIPGRIHIIIVKDNLGI
ncbi:MAG TPA: lactate utilization protein [bacterium]|nr:lactate utilization protein [bacterium]